MTWTKDFIKRIGFIICDIGDLYGVSFIASESVGEDDLF